MANIESISAAHIDHHGPVHPDTSDINVRAVLGFLVGLVVAALAIHLLVWLLFLLFAGREATQIGVQYPLAAGQDRRVPPEPRLQTNPRQDLRDLRAAEDKILNSYGWVDRNRGIVRIPIDEAMKLTVQRGLPARPEKEARK
jgi:hypothetical protein